MIRRRWLGLATMVLLAGVLLTSVLLAGCASNPPQRLFVLSPPAEPARNVPSTATTPSLHLRPVSVPDYLDTTDILLRRGPNEVVPSATGRWGERLSDGITQALAAALVARLPRDPVTLDAPPTSSARQILVTVEAFDVQPDGGCVLAAHWTMIEGNLERRGRATLVTAALEPSRMVGDAMIVAAMAATVSQLADRIVAMSDATRPSRSQ